MTIENNDVTSASDSFTNNIFWVKKISRLSEILYETEVFSSIFAQLSESLRKGDDVPQVVTENFRFRYRFKIQPKA